MEKLTLTKGRPDFPLNEPQLVASGGSTNDTDQVYCIDTLGAEVTLNAGMKKINDDGTTSASAWAGATINGVLYGRWILAGASDGQTACYVVTPANSNS